MTVTELLVKVVELVKEEHRRSQERRLNHWRVRHLGLTASSRSK